MLVNKGFKGKETVDGVETFRYAIGIDKNHAKDYCKALTRRVLDLALAKKLSSNDTESLNKQKESINKDCDESVDDSYDANATLEVKPYVGEVKVEKPVDSIDIQTIMQELGFDQ